TQGQHDTGNARQGQGSAQQRHQRQQQYQVEAQGDTGQHTEAAVDHHHEQHGEDETELGRRDTVGDVLSPQARPDGAFLGKVHGRRQTTGAQQQRQLGGFGRRTQTGDAELVAQGALDGGQADDGLLLNEAGHRHFLHHTVHFLHSGTGYFALLDEEYRHAPADVVAGGAGHQLAAMAGQADIDLGLTVLVEVGLGVGDLVTGEDNDALDI